MNLASHIKHWPENATHAVVFDGEIAFTKGGAPVWDGEEWSILDGAEDSVYWLGKSGKIMSSEWCTKDHIVTRAQWEAERARIAAEEAPTWHIGTETEQWREECQKQYEQELWDKVAREHFLAFAQGEREGGHGNTIAELMVLAGVAADAFMAERAKRLKK